MPPRRCRRPQRCQAAGSGHRTCRVAPHRVQYETILPDAGRTVLRVAAVRDRAQVFVDGRPVGVLERENHEHSLSFLTPRPGARLTALVENQGRVDYGRAVHDRKGLLGEVTVNGLLADWRSRPLGRPGRAALQRHGPVRGARRPPSASPRRSCARDGTRSPFSNCTAPPPGRWNSAAHPISAPSKTEPTTQRGGPPRGTEARPERRRLTWPSHRTAGPLRQESPSPGPGPTVEGAGFPVAPGRMTSLPCLTGRHHRGKPRDHRRSWPSSASGPVNGTSSTTATRPDTRSNPHGSPASRSRPTASPCPARAVHPRELRPTGGLRRAVRPLEGGPAADRDDTSGDPHMSRRWFLASVTFGAAADAVSVKDARPLFSLETGATERGARRTAKRHRKNMPSGGGSWARTDWRKGG
ncbi:hypothetical protein [Streptomyces scabiei]|uniref:hypothetical protein n=1 Tax=Streptomyces scabiei TaxID=1930 RepID=UPI002D21B5FD|nr:hypothetical protein [Streptomyces scabiei]